jgi:hypothetical protein
VAALGFVLCGHPPMHAASRAVASSDALDAHGDGGVLFRIHKRAPKEARGLIPRARGRQIDGLADHDARTPLHLTMIFLPHDEHVARMFRS